MPASNFDFAFIGIGKVLNNSLKVPKYQREYSWEEDQVSQLLEDIGTAWKETGEYFLGTIVTIRPAGQKVLEIVDGQQRITTFTLLMLAIRRYAGIQLKKHILVEKVDGDFLYTIDLKKEEKVPRLRLNIDDNQYFVTLISPDDPPPVPTPTKESHRRLSLAQELCYAWVKEEMSNFPEDARADRLKDLMEFIEEGASVVLLITTDGSQAFKMFETLNDRGLRTSQADLVKSYLFGQSDERIDEAQTRWSSMKDNIEEIPDDDRTVNFLRHVLIATKKFVRAQAVYDVTQASIRGKTPSITFLSELENFSKVYVATYRHDSPHWKHYSDRSRKAVETFNRFGLQPIRPLLMALAAKWKPSDFEKAIQYLVSLSVRLVVSQKTRSGSNEQAFAKAALDVFQGKIAILKDLKVELASVAVSDSEFRDNFATANSSKAELTRYYLRALEQAQGGEDQPWWVPNEDKASINVEHILPKRPKAKDWPNFNEETAKSYRNRIGNQCLLQAKENSISGNEPFADKLDVYAASPYKCTAEVSEYNDWSPDAVEKRQAALADLAVSAWKL